MWLTGVAQPLSFHPPSELAAGKTYPQRGPLSDAEFDAYFLSYGASLSLLHSARSLSLCSEARSIHAGLKVLLAGDVWANYREADFQRKK